jgi:4-amino-4-deoxy-L-arabinose transferase-like glycosyltransferase
MTSETTTTDASPSTPPRGRFASLWPYGLIFLLGLVILLPQLGDFGFWDPWEPKYAQSVREMLERDSYFIPYYRDEARLAKPILTYWSIMAGAAVFGINEFGARIGGVLAALASMLAVYYGVSRIRGRQAGILSAIVLGTMPQFYFVARQATPDVYLFVGLGLSLLFLALGLFVLDERREIHLGVSYVCLAIAVLAKGPVVAGSVFFTTLALFVLIRCEWRWFWRPELKRETWGLLVTTAAGSLTVGTLAATAFLLGTAPKWWGWNSDVHQVLLDVRERIAGFASRWWAAEALLLLAVAATVSGSVYLFKHRSATSRRAVVVPALAVPVVAVMLVALLGLRNNDPAARMLVASTLGALTGLGLMAASAGSFIRHPHVWEAVRGHVGLVGRQVLIFLVTMLAIAGPWYGIVLARKSSLFVNDFIVYNHITRATETINSSGAFDFYWHVLAYGFFPWSCLFPIALGAVVTSRGRNPFRRSPVETYLALACLLTVVIFSCAVTKFSHYMAPILIPAATLVGMTLDRMLRTTSRAFLRVAWLTVFVLYLPMASDLLREYGTIYLVGAFTIKRWVPEAVAPGPFFFALLFVMGAGMLASALFRSRLLIGTLLTAVVAFAVYCSAFFIPSLSAHKTMKNLCETWKQVRSEGKPVGFHGAVKHGIYFYCDSQIALLDQEEFLHFMEPGQQAYAIVERKLLQPAVTRYRDEYPEGVLRFADDSHFRYVLLSNSELGSLAPRDATPQPGG